MVNKLAIIDFLKESQLPKLLLGDLTPSIIDTWQTTCEHHFQKANLAEELQARLNAFTFKDFLLKVHVTYLPRDWDSNICDEAKAVIISRTLLALDKVELHIQLHTGVNSHLKCKLNSSHHAKELKDILLFSQWLLAVKQIDEDLHEEDDHVASAVTKECVKYNACSTNAKCQADTNADGQSKHLKALTNDEHRVLLKYNGCFKCCLPKQDHQSSDCTNSYPDPEMYIPISEDNIQDQIKAVLAEKATKAKLSATILVGDEHADEPAYITAVFPQSTSLGNGTDSDLDEYIPVFSSPNLYWSCLIDRPHLKFSLPIKTLIDDRSHAVLIDESLVCQLGLHQQPLHKPISSNIAFQKDGDSSAELSLSSHWVKLKLHSIDQSFHSLVVPALVMPNLSVPVILGLPFLQCNKIVVDSSKRTAVHKSSSYNLLASSGSPTCPSIPIHKLSTPQQRSHVVAATMTMIDELRQRLLSHKADVDHCCETPLQPHSLPFIRTAIEKLANEQCLLDLDASFKHQFSDRFPEDTPPLTDLPTDVYHRFLFKDPHKVIFSHFYGCSKKYHEAWQTLLTQHLDAGWMCPSSREYAAPAFIIPKSDPTALPQWVNDYRKLNENTISDHFPLPLINDILFDCAKENIWGKIDMTNAFYQTCIHPNDVKYTAVHISFGLYEWLIMSQGCRNAPSTHQCRMTAALRQHIGKICHVYLNNIIIWSQNTEEHEHNVTTILNALRDAHLFCSIKKTSLFCTEIDFLEHHISARGIEANVSKVKQILNWPVPCSAKDVHFFLGLVHYISVFLPQLTAHTSILTPLTMKSAEKLFPAWEQRHQLAFEAMKELVLSHECLTTIDHNNLSQNKIFLTTDASEWGTGAVLSVGPSWMLSHPVAFDSMQISGAAS
ncbi:Transposon Ty3-G Gag-Pol polyprotein [Sparassis crispa]|uniref:Transposon Ty3-G Gag-Pol polyprotein n=1 Tax=Sparassis crispa TaxID=139825 RepID=A0A401GKD4_9APHY|nr:Transposon Ty3-G Gag-Pol polyprotein [Sparassis crispa]GBE82625.1 Transposon Ty3-G Gag-Pol polyprotein [Sparassis crispa]